MRGTSERHRPFGSGFNGEARMAKQGMRSAGHRVGRAACLAGAVGLAAALSAVAAFSQSAYPNRPIRIVVGFAPGGPSDIISRVVGAKMGEIMGAQFII